MVNLVLLRHGESIWNLENRFTGWTDVDLTQKGIEESRQAGESLRKEGITFDITYTSALKRTIKSAFFTLDAMDLLWIPVRKCWMLNERHYGALQGMNKDEAARRYGQAQVQEWRRGYNQAPPLLDKSDRTHPVHDFRYSLVSPSLLPSSESLWEASVRIKNIWDTGIKKRLVSGKRILVSAHGNTLRALTAILEEIPEDEIPKLEFATGELRKYKIDPITHEVCRV